MTDAFEVVSYNLKTGNGPSQEFLVEDGTMGTLEVRVGVQTGITGFSVWLEQCSEETATNWFEFPFERSTKGAGQVLVEGTTRTNGRNVVNNETTSAVVANYTAVYPAMPAGKYRVNWKFTGTDITWGARFSVK